MRYWFLAPDFIFQKDGTIRLGTVLQDPLRPTLILASKGNGLPADLALPAEKSIDETDHEHRRDAGASGSMKMWADFLKTASASASASADVSHNRNFGKVDHEVWSFEHELGDDCLKEIVGIPKVQKHIRSGFLSRKPVYIITGVRIAKTSFSVSTTSNTTATGEVEASASDPTGNVPVGAGAKGNAQVTRSADDSYNTAPGVVFAYQVHIIRQKGDGDVEEELFSHSKAYMTAAGGSGLECLEVTPDVLQECLGKSASVHEHGDDGGDVWISVSSAGA